MIVTVLGGSSQSTPLLAEALASAAPDAAITLRLAGRDPDRLRAVERACGLLAQQSQLTIESFSEPAWTAAIRGSDVVLIQTRIGGYAGREFDETFSLPFGIPGDEGLGPGGLSSAYRAWPELRVLFQTIRANAPKARVILLTSPASLLVRLAHLEFPDWPLLATCELPWTTLLQLCGAAGKQVNDVSFAYMGVNHLGFLYAIRGPEDLLAEYRRFASPDAFPSPDLVHRLGAFPLKYLRLHFFREAVVREQRNRSVPRARHLAELAERAFESFHRDGEAAIWQTLTARPAPWYHQAVVPMLLAEMGRAVQQPVFLSVASESGDVVEREYRRQGDTWCATLGPPAGEVSAPAEAAALVESFRVYESVAAAALRDNTRNALASALSLHPWVAAGDEETLATLIVKQSVPAGAKEERELCPS